MKWMVYLAAVIMALCSWASAEETVKLHAVNVGKADALILRSGEHVYLIDAGTEDSWGQLSCALKINGIEHLDGVIITHTDEDHGGGAMALAQSSVEIDAWYASRWYTCKEKKHPAINAAALRGQEVVWLEGGMTLPLEGGKLTVLGPVRADEEKENNNSVVLLVEGGGCRMLLAGDMEFPEEYDLLDLGLIPRCEVLKVGNHGEEDATSQELASAVRAKIAVISTNTEEEPDTPAKRVLKALGSAKVYQTQDSDAGVLVTLTGGTASAANVVYTKIPPEISGMKLVSKGKDDCVRLRNDGREAVDLSGWYIRSQRGGEIFVFPKGAVIQPGQEIIVASQSTKGHGDYVWPDTTVWHQNKDDEALLCDPYGREMHALH